MAFADTPCAACELSEFPEPAIPLNDEVLLQPAAVEPDEPEHSAFDAIAHIITTILLMPPVLRDVICWRYAGFKYQDIAVPGTEGVVRLETGEAEKEVALNA
jgi:hypothetical protein